MNDLYLGMLTGACASFIASRVVHGRYLGPVWPLTWDWLAMCVLLVVLASIGRL